MPHHMNLLYVGWRRYAFRELEWPSFSLASEQSSRDDDFADIAISLGRGYCRCPNAIYRLTMISLIALIQSAVSVSARI